MRGKIFCGVILALLIALGGISEAVMVDAVGIGARSYEDSVIKELDAATESIYVAMYAVYARRDEDDNPANKFIASLARASRRGVYVRVFLDKSSLYGNDMKHLSKANDEAYAMLDEAGCDVSFIKPTVKMHAKLIVIDGKTVIDGSANWTKKAMRENFESSEILRGEEFARVKLELFDELELAAVSVGQLKKFATERVKVKNSFLEDRLLAPRMVIDNDGYTFDLYLALLRQNAGLGGKIIRIDYAKSARLLGIKVETKNSKYRQEIRRIVENLKSKYGLIDYTITQDGNLDVRVLGYGDVRAGYFNISGGYWEYGLDSRLLLREKFMYMVSIYEHEIQRPRKWWRRSLEGLSKKYYVDEGTICYGLRGLKKQDLIEVRHARVNMAKMDFANKKPNQYRLKELVSPEEKERLWDAVKKEHGAEIFALARELAGMLDEGENVQAVRDLIRIMKQYGEENTRSAVATVALYNKDNPLRNIAYVVGVLKRMERGEA